MWEIENKKDGNWPIKLPAIKDYAEIKLDQIESIIKKSELSAEEKIQLIEKLIKIK